MKIFSLILILLCCSVSSEAEVFSIVHMTDTHTTDIETRLSTQTAWINAERVAYDADNTTGTNIQFAIHTGDFGIGDGDNASMLHASDAMDLLTDVPYIITLGNHDYDNLTAGQDVSKNATVANAAFPYTDLVGGTCEDNKAQNCYTPFTVDGEVFLVVGFDYCATQDTHTWLNGVLDANTDKTVILATHSWMSFVYNTNNRVKSSDEYTQAFTYACTGETFSPEETYQAIVKNHSNVLFVVSGHSWTYNAPIRNGGSRTVDIVGGKATNQMRSNWQGTPLPADHEEFNTFFRLITIDTESDDIIVTSYSPSTGTYDKDYRNSFNLSRTENLGYTSLSGVDCSGITINTE